MNFKFILEMVIMVALGGALYIVARVLPRIDDMDTTPQNPLAPSWLILYFERADTWLVSFFEKLLHRLRIMLLRLDNNMLKRIHKIKKEALKETGPILQEKKEDEENLLEKENLS